MIRTYIQISVFFLIPFVMVSCTKKFLDEPPRRDTITDLVKNPETGAERVMGAIYSNLYEWRLHSFSWMGITSITSDDADKGSDPGDTGADKDVLDNWEFTPSSLSFNEVWIANFEGIGRATYALNFLEQMDLPTAEKDRYMGEAKMLRAYFYWNLVRVFGGVPLINKVLDSEADVIEASTRATREQIYEAIENDLIDAVLLLPASVTPAEYGRVTSYAAQALLAKVYLYQEKWNLSKQMCDAVIAGGFRLMDDYALIWREVGEFSEESIWEVNCIGETQNRGINNYFVVQAPRGAGGLGWGFNTPSQDLVDAYEVGDVRKAATIITSGDTLWDGHITNPNAPNKYYNYKSYVSKTMETFNGNDIETNKNLRVIRFGEILLISAEVENELGNLQAAESALNKIRDRAGLGNTTATNKDEMRQAIWKERRVEMAFEHDRMFDLHRTGRAGEVLRAHGKNYIDGKHDIFPIPQTQIDLSDQRLVQNPDYN